MHYESQSDNTASNTVYYEQQENFICIDRQYLLLITEKISVDPKCKYRQATLRLFNHLLVSADMEGKISFSAKRLSKKLGIHHDTVTKCIKYLKGIEVIKSAK